MNKTNDRNKYIKNIIFIIVILSLATSLIVINVINKNKTGTKTSLCIKICTTFYPEYLIVNNLTEGVTNVEITNITSNIKGCIHDYVLTTSDMKNIVDSDILILNGADMEGFIYNYINQNKSINFIDSSIGTKKIINEDTNETNSHIYLDVENYIIQLNNIYKGLINLSFTDYEKDIIKDNKDSYIKKLNELERYSQKLNNLKPSSVILSHDSFEYIIKNYNINIINILEEEHESEISSKTIASIINTNKKKKINAIFVSEDFDISRIKNLIDETKINVYVLSAITSKETNKDYIELMKQNIDIIYNALQG